MQTWKLGTFILILGLLASSCGTFHSVGVGATSGLFYKASKEMETEGNWKTFKKAVPPNLKLIEGLLYVNPDDENLLVSLIKGHTGYAYAVEETQWMADDFQDQETSEHKKQALYHYSRAFEHALTYFKESGFDFNDLKKSLRNTGGIPEFVDDHLDDSDEQDLEAALFGGQALAAMVNLQRDNMLMVAELPVAKGLFDWVCDNRPDINFGACQIFYGAYYAGRPAMLGGNPEKGRKIFQKLIKEHPHNWLGKVAYMQYYLVPHAKEKEYRKLATEMREYSERHRQKLKWSPVSDPRSEESFSEPRLRIYQAMAIERFKVLERFSAEFF